MPSIRWAELKAAASEAGFSLVPAGDYNATVFKATAGMSSNGDKPNVKVQFKIDDGPYAGQSVFSTFTLTADNPTALGFFFRHLGALGLNDAFFAQYPVLDDLEPVAKAITNRRCRLRTVIDTWGGQERTKVNTVLPPSEPEPSGPPVTGSMDGLSQFAPAATTPSYLAEQGPPQRSEPDPPALPF